MRNHLVSRSLAERKQEALLLSCRISNLLDGNLDYEVLVRKAAHLIVERLVSWCVIDLVSEAGQVRRVAVAHKDPKMEEYTQAIMHRYPPSPTANRGVYKVIETGKTIMIPVMTYDDWAQRADDPEHLQIIMELGSTSYMCVPLIARGKPIGALMLFSGIRTLDEYDIQVAEDISRRLALVVDNLQMFLSMQNAIKVRDEFLNNLSHELRTPSTIISGWLQMLKTESLNEIVFKQTIQAIERNFVNQSKLINDLLDVSQIISGKFKIQREVVNVAETIERAIKELESESRSKRIMMDIRVESQAQYLFGDPTHLTRMFSHILANSIKFTPTNGCIRVFLYTDKDQIAIEISDTGVGLQAEFAGEVFVPFSQENGTVRREHGGLGIGMTIVKQIVSLHDGEIKIQSPGKGRGTMVNLTFPKLKRIPGLAVQTRSDSTVLSPGPVLLGVRILLVDDAEEMRVLLNRILKKAGAEVLTASKAAEAFEMVRSLQPDVLISDIGMPEEDGYSLIRRIRSLPPMEGGDICALALSAYVGDSEKQVAFRCGFNNFISKPVSNSELIGGVCQLIGRSH